MRQSSLKGLMVLVLRLSENIVSKREQRRTCLISAEREQCLCIARTCLQAGLALTALRALQERLAQE